jgi:hypothetical protein
MKKKKMMKGSMMPTDCDMKMSDFKVKFGKMKKTKKTRY